MPSAGQSRAAISVRKSAIMRIIGIHFGHDANAALVQDGIVTHAVSEDRLNRVKGWRGFPAQAIAWILSSGGCRPQDVDAVVIPNQSAQDETLGGDLATFYDRLGLRAPLWARMASPLLGIIDTLFDLKWRRAIARGMVEDMLFSMGFAAHQIKYVDHHLGHAAGAFFMSGFDAALVVTADGKGDRLSHTTSWAKGNDIKRVAESRDFDSPGFFYSAITGFLGFKKLRHEGKITGLAAYGDIDEVRSVDCPLALDSHQNHFRNTLIPNAEASGRLSGLFGFFRRHPRMFLRMLPRTSALMAVYSQEAFEAYFKKRFAGIAREHVAAFAQKHLERLMVQLVTHKVDTANPTFVALSGGVFANVRVNQMIREIPGVKSVFVQPGMADCGLGPGAALWHYWKDRPDSTRPRLEHAYLGPGFDDEEIKEALDRHSIVADRVDDIETHIVDALVEGKCIGRYNGRMEWGPRALGNRSIIAAATDAAINKTLNDRLQRTEFMPFAPIILAEHAADWIEGWSPKDSAAEFMTITYDIAPDKAQRIPAVVHVDGTARPQVVRKDVNPSLHRVLTLYYERTNIPVLINTSFNMHEEPIVCSPDDAARAFAQGAIDVLAAGNWIAHNGVEVE